MIKKFLLPEGLCLFLLVRTTGFDLQRLDKVREIAGWKESFGQEMKMVGHDAIGVDCESPGSRFGTEYFEKPAAG